MIIPITLNTSSSASHSNSAPRLPSGLAKISNDEVVLIELQGFLDVEANPPEERNGQFVGKLKIDDNGKPSLVIGHHLLEGKIAPLAKPLAIFHRVGGPAPRIAGSSSSSSSEPASTGKGKGKMNVDDDTPRKRRRTTGGEGANGDTNDDDGMDIDTDEPTTALSKSLKSSSLESPSDDDGETQETQATDSNLEGEGEGQGGVASWTIVGIVKKKITFSNRPMPISGLSGGKKL